MKDVLIQILTTLGVLSIPSIIWNIFLYKKNKEYRKWDAERNLKKLDTQKRNIESEFENSSKKLSEDYTDRRYQDFDTQSEQLIAWEGSQELLQEQKNSNLSKIDADIDYVKKISEKEASAIFF